MSRLMFHNTMKWEDSTPPALLPSVRVVRKVFEDGAFKVLVVTENICRSMLRPDLWDGKPNEYMVAFHQMKAWLGPWAAKCFDVYVAGDTPASLYYAYFRFWVEGLTIQADEAFRELLRLGLSGRLEADPISWAKAQNSHLVRSQAYQVSDCRRRDCQLKLVPC